MIASHAAGSRGDGTVRERALRREERLLHGVLGLVTVTEKRPADGADEADMSRVQLLDTLRNPGRSRELPLGVGRCAHREIVRPVQAGRLPQGCELPEVVDGPGRRKRHDANLRRAA